MNLDQIIISSAGGILDFIYFISSPSLQDLLFPVKLVFVFFTMFFLAAVIYFMVNSSWLQYKFVEDVTEFFSWRAYGLKEITKFWARIRKKLETSLASELKLAIIESDDFLSNMLDERGFEGKNFEEILEKAGKVILPNIEQVRWAHEERNSVVYNPDYKIDQASAKKILSVYEDAINRLAAL